MLGNKNRVELSKIILEQNQTSDLDHMLHNIASATDHTWQKKLWKTCLSLMSLILQQVVGRDLRRSLQRGVAFVGGISFELENQKTPLTYFGPV